MLEPGTHVRFRGEDVHAGDLIAAAGEPLTLARVSSLAAAGVGEIAVHRRARLHLLVTGSELLPLGAPPEPGKIHESNGLMVRLLAERAGAQVIDGGVIADDFDSTRAAVEAGLSGDVLVVSGGVSVGPHDHVKPAFEACGVEELFWRVRVKPGKPLWFGRRGDTLVFGLPGNPLSSIVGFLAFIEPALRRLHGEPDASMRTVPARLTTEAGPSDGRTTFLTSRLVPGRRRRARGDADRQPGLAPDGRARAERRLRDRPPRLRPAGGRVDRRRRPVCLAGASPTSVSGIARTRGAGSGAASTCGRSWRCWSCSTSSGATASAATRTATARTGPTRPATRGRTTRTRGSGTRRTSSCRSRSWSRLAGSVFLIAHNRRRAVILTIASIVITVAFVVWVQVSPPVGSD